MTAGQIIQTLSCPDMYITSPKSYYSHVLQCTCHVCVVVQFYPWFKFSFLLFLGMEMYDNDMIMSLKQKKRKFEPRIKLNHNICMERHSLVRDNLGVNDIGSEAYGAEHLSIASAKPVCSGLSLRIMPSLELQIVVGLRTNMYDLNRPMSDNILTLIGPNVQKN